MAQVAREPIIVTDEDLSKAHMLRLFNERGYRLAIAHEAGAMETMRSLAANGLGVGLSYTHPRADVTYDGKGVRQIPIVDAASTEPVILVTHRDNAPSKNAQAVCGAILALSLEL
jgi:DNA-binding transcriptional LysR family regulator